MPSIKEFVEREKLSILLTGETRSTPYMSGDDMDGYLVILERVVGNPDRHYLTNGVMMPVYFSMGRGHRGHAPEIEMVLESLVLDIQGVIDGDYDDWAGEYGGTLATYRSIKEQARLLRWFLGKSAFSELISGEVTF